jgi:hypothetical protein
MSTISRVLLLILSCVLVTGLTFGCRESSHLAIRLETSKLALESGQSLSDLGVVGLQISVTGPDMADMNELFLEVEKGAFTVSGIPEGNDRTITVTLFDSKKVTVLYGARDGVRISGGHNTPVAITVKHAPIAYGSETDKASVVINNADELCNDIAVTLDLTAEHATHAQVSNQEDLLDAQVRPLGSDIEWTLPDDKEDGLYRVYVRFYDESEPDRYSKPVSDSIVLDSTPPLSPAISFLSESLVEDDQGIMLPATHEQQVAVLLLAGDASEFLLHSELPEAGITPITRLSKDDQKPLPSDTWLTYHPEMTATLDLAEGRHGLRISYKDPAGNEIEAPLAEIYFMRPDIAVTLAPEVDLPASCTPSGDELSSVKVGTPLVVTGTTTDLPGIGVISATLNWSTGPDGPVETSPVPPSTFTLKDGILSGNPVVPDEVMDNSVLTLSVVVGKEDSDGLWISSTDSGVSEPLLVDLTPPVASDYSLSPVHFGASQVAAHISADGACALKLSGDLSEETGWEAMVAEVIELDLMLLADDNAEKTVWLTLMDSAGNQSEPQAATVNVYTSATIPELTLSMTPAVPSPFAELAVKPGSALTLNGQVQIFGAPVYQSGFTIASAQLTMGDQLINLGDLVISETGNLTGSTTVPTLDSPPPDGTKLSATVIIEAPWGAASTPAYSNSLDFYGAGPAIITANLTGGGPCVADSTTQVELNATGASHARISGDILNGAQWISLPPGEQLLPIELTPGSGSKKLLLELSNPAGVTTATELLVLLDQTPPEILNLQVTLDGLAPPFAGDGNPILNQPSVALAVSAIDEPLCGPMNVIFGCLDNDADCPIDETVKSYQESLVIPIAGADGTKSFSVALCDAVGNCTGTADDGGEKIVIHLDREPPVSPSVQLPDILSGLIGSCQLNVKVGATDTDNWIPGGPSLAVRLEGAFGADGDWQSIASGQIVSVPATLSDTACSHGKQGIAMARFKDLAGNITDPVTAPFTLNLNPPTTPLLLADNLLFSDTTIMNITRGEASDADFVGVHQRVCPWCDLQAPQDCECDEQGFSDSKLLTFTLPEADVPCAACIFAEDFFGLFGEWECVTLVQDLTPPVTRLECWTDSNFDGLIGKHETWPCPGGRLPRHTSLVASPGERYDSSSAAVLIKGIGGEIENFVSAAKTPLLHDSSTPLTVTSVDSAGNQETPRNTYFTFTYDNQSFPLSLPTGPGATATRLDTGDVLLIGGERTGITVPDYVLLRDSDFRTIASAQHELAQRQDHTAITLSDGSIALLGGGQRTAPETELTLLDTIALFSATGEPDLSIPAPFGPRIGNSTTQSGKYIVMAGGLGPLNTVLDEVLVIDSETWTVQDSLSGYPFSHHAAAVLADGTVVLTGGFLESGDATASMAIINPGPPATLQVIPADMSARGLHTMVTLDNGNLFLAGGLTHFSKTGDIDPETILLSTVRMTPQGVSMGSNEDELLAGTGHATIKLSNGGLLLAGGQGPAGLSRQIMSYSQHGLLDSTSTLSGPPRADAQIVPAGTDGAFLFGGRSNSIEPLDDGVYIGGNAGLSYLPDEWDTTRYSGATLLLPSGEIFMVGGFTNGSQAATAVRIAPDGSIVNVVSDKKFDFALAPHVLLPTGNLFIIGGEATDFSLGVYPSPYAPIPRAMIVTPDGEILQELQHEWFARVKTDVLLVDHDHLLLVGGGRQEDTGQVWDDALVIKLDTDSLVSVDAQGIPEVIRTQGIIGPRARHRMIRLDDGRFMVTGGTPDWNFNHAVNEADVISVSADGTVVLEAVSDDIGFPRVEHGMIILPNGDLIIAGGTSKYSTNVSDPSKYNGVILYGSGPQIGQVKATLADLHGPRFYSAMGRMISGNPILAGGRYPHAVVTSQTPNHSAILLDGEGQISATLRFPFVAGWESTVVPLFDGRAMMIGGNNSSQQVSAEIPSVNGQRLLFSFASITETWQELWDGATIVSSTGPLAPDQLTGINAHVPPASCTSGKLQHGPDRRFRLPVPPETTFYVTATPIGDFDLSIYSIMMPMDRDGHVCYDGADNAPAGEPETIVVNGTDVAPWGVAWIIVDSKTPELTGDFSLKVYRNPSELD